MSGAMHAMPLTTPKNIFSYNLGVKVIPASSKDAQQVTLCCHGYGHCNEIVDAVRSYNVFKGPLVGFNFPDFNITDKVNHARSAYGTIKEILPLLYLIKYYACDQQILVVNLYGFSAGGGAIVNALAILHKMSHKQELAKIGITKQHVAQMLAALERGIIVLDCPLKSIDEIRALRGSSPELDALARHYADNKMNPIDVLPSLAGMKMNIIIHFQRPDDVLGNRDDKLFIDHLKKANKGTTTVVLASEGGHNSYHKKLCDAIKKMSI